MKDAAYCFPCRLFGGGSAVTSRPEKVFSMNGFRDWKHASGAKGSLASHNVCLSHKEAVVAWEQYKSTHHRGSVAEQLGSVRAELVQKNRHYLKTIVEVLYCVVSKK